MESFEDIFRKKFGDELLDVKVSLWPQQAFVKVVLKTVTPEATAFARDIKLEFAELDRQVDIQVVACQAKLREEHGHLKEICRRQ